MTIAMRYARDEMDAADIMSHAFIKVFKSIHSFDSSSNKTELPPNTNNKRQATRPPVINDRSLPADSVLHIPADSPLVFPPPLILVPPPPAGSPVIKPGPGVVPPPPAKDSVLTPKKSRGVKGISDSDYKIITKRDSTKR
jgi:hypothetical protein